MGEMGQAARFAHMFFQDGHLYRSWGLVLVVQVGHHGPFRCPSARSPGHATPLTTFAYVYPLGCSGALDICMLLPRKEGGSDSLRLGRS